MCVLGKVGGSGMQGGENGATALDIQGKGASKEWNHKN